VCFPFPPMRLSYFFFPIVSFLLIGHKIFFIFLLFSLFKNVYDWNSSVALRGTHTLSPWVVFICLTPILVPFIGRDMVLCLPLSFRPFITNWFSLFTFFDKNPHTYFPHSPFFPLWVAHGCPPPFLLFIVFFFTIVIPTVLLTFSLFWSSSRKSGEMAVAPFSHPPRLLYLLPLVSFLFECFPFLLPFRSIPPFSSLFVHMATFISLSHSPLYRFLGCHGRPRIPLSLF